MEIQQPPTGGFFSSSKNHRSKKMNACKTKAARPGMVKAASKTSICPNYTLVKRLLNTVAASIRHAYWLLSFSIEDASQRRALRKNGGAK